MSRVWCVADAGLVVNPDGARNQLEGGIVQAVELDAEGTGAARRRPASPRATGTSYPILRFSEVPEIAGRAGRRRRRPAPLGIGECSVGPTAAAIGNAVAHALGMRIHDMPLTRERIMAALLRS